MPTTSSWRAARRVPGLARASAVSAGAGAGLLLGFEVVSWISGRPEGSPLAVAVAAVPTVVLTLLAVGFQRAPDRMPMSAPLVVALTAPLSILALGVVAPERGAAGQIGLVYGPVYAAVFLPAATAWMVAAVSVAAEAVVVAVAIPGPEAFAELVAVGSAILVITYLVVEVGRQQDRLSAELSELAAVDGLTGLSSRRVLEAAAGAAFGPGGAHDVHSHLRHTRRRSDQGTGLISVDLDHLKHLNDDWGHPVGDAALRHVADLLREAVGAVMAAGTAATVARFGGDEFAILLIRSDAAAVTAAAEAVVEAVRLNPLQVPGGEVPLSASVGVAYVQAGHRGSMATLYATSDAALYRAKAAGRGRMAVG